MTDGAKKSPLDARAMGSGEEEAGYYVCAGSGVVMLCELGDLQRWRNSVGFEPDEAEKLGVALIGLARQARLSAEEDAAAYDTPEKRAAAEAEIDAVEAEDGRAAVAAAKAEKKAKETEA